MKTAFQTALLCSAMALVGGAALAQEIQPLDGDGTVASQTGTEIAPVAATVIGVTAGGVLIAAAGGFDGDDGDGDSTTTTTTTE